MYRTIMVATVIFSIFSMHEARAGQCSEYLFKAMRDEGLSMDEINAICTRAEQYAHSKKTIFTPEKIKHDLEGRSVGPEVIVKVKSDEERSRSADGTKDNSSYSAFVPVPMGITFDRSNITRIKILQAKTTGSKAMLIVHVETNSHESGKLRLRYEYLADEWILRQLENLSFKEQ